MQKCWCVIYSVPVISTVTGVSGVPGRVGVPVVLVYLVFNGVPGCVSVPGCVGVPGYIGVPGFVSVPGSPVISTDWMVSVYPLAGRGDGAQWCARTISAPCVPLAMSHSHTSLTLSLSLLTLSAIIKRIIVPAPLRLLARRLQCLILISRIFQCTYFISGL